MLVLTTFTLDCFSKNSLHPCTYSNFKNLFSKYQISQLNTIAYHKYTKLFTRTSYQTETPLIYLVHRVWWTSLASKVNDETNTQSKLNRTWLKQCVLTETMCINWNNRSSLFECAFRYRRRIRHNRRYSMKKLHESWRSHSQRHKRICKRGHIRSVYVAFKLLITGCVRIQVVLHYMPNYRFSSQMDYPGAAIMWDSM